MTILPSSPARPSRGPLPARRGVTIIELLMVLAIMALVVAAAMPKIGRGIAQGRVDRASRVATADLRLASQLASRHRRPIRWIRGTTDGQQGYRITNGVLPETVFVNRRLGGPLSEYQITSLTASPRDTITFYPTGVASSNLTLTLAAAGFTRTVNMTRVGFVR